MRPAASPGHQGRRAEGAEAGPLTGERLVELYVTQRLSSVAIARRFGMSPRAVCEQLHRAGIRPRGGADAKEPASRELLVENGASDSRTSFSGRPTLASPRWVAALWRNWWRSVRP
ncbi:MAG: hypothetical protein Q8K72_21795 [Acidimicrobiales bacterium]|nr:hypothetical protein [Acidimicrobiales bacterium]